MSVTAEAVVAIITIMVGIPAAILLAINWYTRMSKGDVEERLRRFSERLIHPDFAAIEEHYGRRLPKCVEALYSDPVEVKRAGFEVAFDRGAAEEGRWYVVYYQPADAESVKDAWPRLEMLFAFADDGFGNGCLIDPKEPEPPVLSHDHETGELTTVCETFSEFMLWPRMEVER